MAKVKFDKLEVDFKFNVGDKVLIDGHEHAEITSCNYTQRKGNFYGIKNSDGLVGFAPEFQIQQRKTDAD